MALFRVLWPVIRHSQHKNVIVNFPDLQSTTIQSDWKTTPSRKEPAPGEIAGPLHRAGVIRRMLVFKADYFVSARRSILAAIFWNAALSAAPFAAS